METLLVTSIVIACVSAFVVTLLKKWHVCEFMQTHGDDFTYKLFSCNFCMSFWISSLISVFLVAWNCELIYIAVPIVATPISNYIITY